MLVYLDTNIVIYMVEQVAELGAAAEMCVDGLRAEGAEFVVSRLVRMECLVGPLRKGAPDMVAAFDAFFCSPAVRFVEVTPAALDRAAGIRAQYRFNTPDAIHLASALESGCDALLTNDPRLSSCGELAVKVLP